MKIIVDFETYSEVDIGCGANKYASDDSTDIVCLAYKVNDKPTQLWLPDKPVPQEFWDTERIYAHNALFDYLIWRRVGARRYGFPERALATWIDTIALANRVGLPSALDKLSDILDLGHKKNKEGVSLIKKICRPDDQGERPVVAEAWLQRLYQYCIDDVDATYALLKALPMKRLLPKEQKIWLLTQSMNLYGLPVDIETVRILSTYVREQTNEQIKLMPKLTNKAVQKPTQVKAIRDWCATQGVHLPDLTAATVAATLENADIPEKVRQVLELRDMFGNSSVAKYEKIKDYHINGRVHDTLQYYGAHTGRWAGRGIQPQNFPRYSTKNIDQVIDDIRNFRPIDNAPLVAKGLVRAMICAPRGKKLMVCDFSSIENRVIAYLSGDKDTLKKFAEGFDQYIDMAAYLYGKRYDDVDVEGPERQIGKVIILGCGFGMGWKTFQKTAAKWGIKLKDYEAKDAVDAFRARYSLVARAWYTLYECAKETVRGHPQEYGHIRYATVVDHNDRNWLVCYIKPSQRAIYYMEPKIDEDGQLTVMGTNPYTKKWQRDALKPGVMLQNPTQGFARDIMAEGMLNVEYLLNQVMLIGTVHDEAIAEVDDEYATPAYLDAYSRALCRTADNRAWPGLPLEAKGYIAQRYRK
jgi:DNA polymerase